MNQELKKYEQNISQAWQFNKIAKKYATGHFLDYEGTQESYDFGRTIINYCYRKKTEYIKKAIKIANKNNYIYGKKEDIIYFETKDEKQISFHDYNNIFNDLPTYIKDWIGKKFNKNPILMKKSEYDEYNNDDNYRDICEEEYIDIVEKTIYLENSKRLKDFILEDGKKKYFSMKDKKEKFFLNYIFPSLEKLEIDKKVILNNFLKDNTYDVFFKNCFLINRRCYGLEICENIKELNSSINTIVNYDEEIEQIFYYNIKNLNVTSIDIISKKFIIIETDYPALDFDKSFNKYIMIEI